MNQFTEAYTACLDSAQTTRPTLRSGPGSPWTRPTCRC